jgi:hypothetical protein
MALFEAYGEELATAIARRSPAVEEKLSESLIAIAPESSYGETS